MATPNLAGVRVYYVTSPVKAAMIVRNVATLNDAAENVYDVGTPSLSAIPVYAVTAAVKAATLVHKVN